MPFPYWRAVLVAMVSLSALIARAEPSVRVVATTTVVADLVRQVGGPQVAVESLMAEGVDPHSYRATPRDADRLFRADLVVANGLHLEGKLAELLTRLGRRRPVVAVGDALAEADLLPIGNGLFDPHIWFDAALGAGVRLLWQKPWGESIEPTRKAITNGRRPTLNVCEHLMRPSAHLFRTFRLPNGS